MMFENVILYSNNSVEPLWLQKDRAITGKLIQKDRAITSYENHIVRLNYCWTEMQTKRWWVVIIKERAHRKRRQAMGEVSFKLIAARW